MIITTENSIYELKHIEINLTEPGVGLEIRNEYQLEKIGIHDHRSTALFIGQKVMGSDIMFDKAGRLTLLNEFGNVVVRTSKLTFK